jgi:hypothetical protein
MNMIFMRKIKGAPVLDPAGALRPNSESKEGDCVPGQGFNKNSTHLILI